MSKRAEDKRRNIEKIIHGLRSCQMATPFSSPSDFLKPFNQREMLLLCI
jgi:hypothetical protein